MGITRRRTRQKRFTPQQNILKPARLHSLLPVNELYSSIYYSGAVVLLNRLSYTTTIW